MGAVTTLVKALFLLFNFVFWVTGVALLVVGILVKFSFSYIMKLSKDINLNLAPYILIGCGVFIILVGFMGCWASIKEHGWALKLYMFVLILLFIVEIIGGIAGFIMRAKLDTVLKSAIRNGVDHYKTDTDLHDAMDQVQQKIKCCGVTTYKDYINSTAAKGNSTESVPKSCCINSNGKDCAYLDLRGKSLNATGIYTKGCYDTLLHSAKENILIIVGVAIGIAVFQIFGVLSGFKLTKKFKERNYEKM